MVDFLSKEDGKAISEAIFLAEKETSGEICVHVKKRCRKNTLEEAKTIFRKIGMHKTRQRNGVLIFIAPESHDFAILGDEGIYRKAGEEFWDETRDLMLSYFSKGLLREGIIAGIQSAGKKLKTHFPAHEKQNPNELPDSPSET